MPVGAMGRVAAIVDAVVRSEPAAGSDPAEGRLEPRVEEQARNAVIDLCLRHPLPYYPVLFGESSNLESDSPWPLSV
jgi:hypothetical protein